VIRGALRPDPEAVRRLTGRRVVALQQQHTTDSFFTICRHQHLPTTPMSGVLFAVGVCVCDLLIVLHPQVIRGALRADTEAVRRLTGRRVVAFSGTARPERFFRSLRALGCRVCEALALPDHAQIPAGELERLRQVADSEGAMLVKIYIYVCNIYRCIYIYI